MSATRAARRDAAILMAIDWETRRMMLVLSVALLVVGVVALTIGRPMVDLICCAAALVLQITGVVAIWRERRSE